MATERQATTKRSLPGCGERVRIICADADAADGGFEPADACCVNDDAEDYAAGRQTWPVIVKARRDLDDAAIVRHLLYLASVLDQARRVTP